MWRVFVVSHKRTPKDTLIQRLRKEIMEGHSHPGFTLVGEKVLYKGQVLVPASSAITKALLQKTYLRLATQ